MSISKTKIDEDVWSKFRITIWQIALDTSYPTGGYGASLGFSAQALGVGSFIGVYIIGLNAAGSGIVQLAFDYTNNKLMAFRVATFTPAGTIAAPVFTGAALAAHGHVLFVNDGGAAADAEATRLNSSASDGLVSETADTSIPSVPDVSGDGGIVDITAGTPAGTNSAPAFTGGAQGQIALAQVSNAVNLAAVSARIMVVGR